MQFSKIIVFRYADFFNDFSVMSNFSILIPILILIPSLIPIWVRFRSEFDSDLSSIPILRFSDFEFDSKFDSKFDSEFAPILSLIPAEFCIFYLFELKS